MKTMSLDIKDIILKGFQFGMTMDGVFHDDGEGHIGIYLINSESATIIYRCKIDDGWEYVKQHVQFDWLSRHYGSNQACFLCPECGKRVAQLHNEGTTFMCRHCIRLAKNRFIHENESARRASIDSKLGSTINFYMWM